MGIYVADVKILVIEDDAIEAMDIKRTLESFGYSVPYVASRGEEVSEKAIEIMPDLVLMDIILKGKENGIDAASKIKDLNIPLIYLTAHSEASTVEKAKITEPYGYLIKPFDVLELKFAIELALYKHQQETLLKESEARYQNVINYMKRGVAVYGAVDHGNDFVFKDFNRAGEHIDGVKKEDIIGKRITAVFPEVGNFGLLNVLRRVYETGVPEHFPISQYKDNRISGWRENFVYKLPSNEIVAVYEDLTESKQAEERLKDSEEKFSNAFYGNLIAMDITDKKGSYIDVNNSFCQLTGFAREELIGHTADELNIINHERRKEILSEAHKMKIQGLESIIRTKSGEKRIVRINVKQFESKNQKMFISSIEDITEKKRSI